MPHYFPLRRRRLIDALEKLGEPQNVMVRTRLWSDVLVDEQKCSGCQMCAVFCPSGALSKYREVDEQAMRACAKLYKAPGNPRVVLAAEGSGARGGAGCGAGDGSGGSGAAANGLQSKQKVIYKHHKNTSSSCSFATGEQVDLIFNSKLCLGCDTCRQVCPKHAIQRSDSVAARHLVSGFTKVIPLKDISREKGGPDAIRNSMSKLINSAYIWG
jgi:Fe-S-cluster-containing hydrogenase component 2